MDVKSAHLIQFVRIVMRVTIFWEEEQDALLAIKPCLSANLVQVLQHVLLAVTETFLPTTAAIPALVF